VSVEARDLAWALKFMAVDGAYTREVKARLEVALCREDRPAESPRERFYERQFRASLFRAKQPTDNDTIGPN
jgi:hypothetical protein